MFPTDAVDDAGLLLPDAGWPADRTAPGALEVLRRFVNTANLESGAERWRSPAAVEAWLADEGHPGWSVTRSDVRRMIELREVLRELAVANHDDAVADVEAPPLLDDLRLGVRLRGGTLAAAPVHAGVDGLLERIAAIAVLAAADGTWTRLKACRNQVCRWAYYDHSRNQRGRWCSMRTCGNRRKARTYRARTREDGAAQAAPPDARSDR